jgi:hypothetical protein
MLGAALRLAPGLWGGEHVRMVVSESGARLEYDCADSTIDGPIDVDGRGRFKAKGEYIPGRGGPRRGGEGAASSRVVYSGQVTNDTMKLTVRLESRTRPIGVFTLKRGEEPLLMKCR